ncbi:hypothetical protein B296_00009785 [Ensete ventricosum]|uniref:Uncharacterized protein n=1 Tax=Ensete ventricosum TaxID=4639 RepID=A0A427AE14_ENSVE|nr:hypothetical protein B296_00009785 [Ensete ventricosum]
MRGARPRYEGGDLHGTTWGPPASIGGAEAVAARDKRNRMDEAGAIVEQAQQRKSRRMQQPKEAMGIEASVTGAGPRGWSPKDSMESVATWRRRGVGGVALAMLQEGSVGGRGDWATIGGRYREGTQQIAGARDYISKGKERLVVLTEAGSGRRLSPCGCYIMTHPSKEGV